MTHKVLTTVWMTHSARRTVVIDKQVHALMKPYLFDNFIVLRDNSSVM